MKDSSTKYECRVFSNVEASADNILCRWLLLFRLCNKQHRNFWGVFKLAKRRKKNCEVICARLKPLECIRRII